MNQWHHPDCYGECIACLIEREIQSAYGNQGLDYLRRHVTAPPQPEPMIDGRPLYSGLPPVKVQDERETQYKSWAQSAQVIGGQYDPRRELVGLTNEEKKVICQEAANEDWTDLDVINATEAKLREKNG